MLGGTGDVVERGRAEPVVDTHAHLDFPQFDADRDKVLGRALEAGVRWMVNPGADLESSRRAIALAQRCHHVYAAVGVHPHDARTVTPEVMKELRELAAHPKVVAIGEIGLDYYRDLSPRSAQRQAFVAQLELAGEVGLPIIVHDREAHEDVVEILEAWAGAQERARGVLHAFSGDRDMAGRVLGMGFHIALGGPITYRNARRLPDLVAALPLDRLVVETDCPYLTPHPYRGRRNEPAYVRLIVDKLAELQGLGVDQVSRQTTRNAQSLFDLPTADH